METSQDIASLDLRETLYKARLAALHAFETYCNDPSTSNFEETIRLLIAIRRINDEYVRTQEGIQWSPQQRR